MKKNIEENYLIDAIGVFEIFFSAKLSRKTPEFQEKIVFSCYPILSLSLTSSFSILPRSFSISLSPGEFSLRNNGIWIKRVKESKKRKMEKMKIESKTKLYDLNTLSIIKKGKKWK